MAIFAALASSIASQGIEVLATYAKFVGGFYLSMGLLWAVLIAAGFAVVGPRILRLVNMIRAPALLAFSTAYASRKVALPGWLGRCLNRLMGGLFVGLGIKLAVE